MSVCSHCAIYIAHNNEKRCVKCKSVLYCNRACQVKAWPGHRKACKEIAYAAFRRQICFIGPTPGTAHLFATALAETCGWYDMYDKVVRLKTNEDYVGMLAVKDKTLKVAESLIHTLRTHSGAIACVGTTMMYMSVAETLMRLGGAVAKQHDYRGAIILNKQSRTIAEYTNLVQGDGDERQDLLNVVEDYKNSRISIHSNLAHAYEDANDNDNALISHNKAMSLCTEDMSYDFKMSCILGLAGCHGTRGETTSAQKLYNKAVVLAKEHGNSIDLMYVYGKLGCLSQQMRHYTRAHCLFKKQRELAFNIDNHDEMLACDASMAGCKWAEARSGCGSASTRKNAMREAGELLVGSLTSAESCGDNGLYSQILLCIALQRYDTGEHCWALIYLEKLLRVMRSNDTLVCTDCSQCQHAQAPLLSCGRCRVARFCNKDCQRRASAPQSITRNRHIVEHRRICPLLRAHRLQTQDRKPGPKLKALMLAFLAKSGGLLPSMLVYAST